MLIVTQICTTESVGLNLCKGSCSWCSSLLWLGSPLSSDTRAVRYVFPHSVLYCMHSHHLTQKKIKGKTLKMNQDNCKIL